jgi:hypothetical protein
MSHYFKYSCDPKKGNLTFVPTNLLLQLEMRYKNKCSLIQKLILKLKECKNVISIYDDGDHQIHIKVKTLDTKKKIDKIITNYIEQEFIPENFPTLKELIKNKLEHHHFFTKAVACFFQNNIKDFDYIYDKHLKVYK